MKLVWTLETESSKVDLIFNLEIEQRIMATITNPEILKTNKHEKDNLMSSFDLQNKIRDTLIKKIFGMQDTKKYK